MKIEYSKNLVLRIIEHALENPQTSLNSIQQSLALQPEEADYLRRYLINWGDETAPNHILTVPSSSPDGRVSPDENLQLLPNAVFSYIDYQEILQARQAAMEARKLAWIAIWISIATGVLGIFLGMVQVFIAFDHGNI